jgi:HEAT repeat protein
VIVLLLALLSPGPLRADAVQGLARLRAPGKETPSWAVLRRALQSRDYAVRLLAVQALGSVRSVDVTSWLEHCLSDPEHDVRVAAVDALDRLHSRRGLLLLRSVRDDESEELDIRALAAGALINQSDE